MSQKLLSILVVGLFITACGEVTESDDLEVVANIVGDVMASADEASGDSEGNYAASALQFQPTSSEFAMDRFANTIESAFLPSAHAGFCSQHNGWGACDSGKITRDFEECLVGAYNIIGTVDLTFTGDGDCLLDEDGESVTRIPNFTIDGIFVDLAVSGEQIVTRVSEEEYLYRNVGMRRTATGITDKTYLDIETKTLEDITVTGSTRAERVMNGGVLEVNHLIADFTSTLSPEDIAWSEDCNCAVSGKWVGSSTGTYEFASLEIEILSCGNVKVTADGEEFEYELDRCAD